MIRAVLIGALLAGCDEVARAECAEVDQCDVDPTLDVLLCEADDGRVFLEVSDADGVQVSGPLWCEPEPEGCSGTQFEQAQHVCAAISDRGA